MSECPFQSRLSAFHDRELDAELAAKLESHLSGCQECQQGLQGIRAVSRLLSPPESVRMSQMGVARLHAVADAAARRRDVFPLARALLAVAASVLVIAGAWLYETPRPIPSGQGIVEVKPEADWEKFARGAKVTPVEAGHETGVAGDFSEWMLRNLEQRKSGS
jgi:anti-sigma factor RsiW